MKNGWSRPAAVRQPWGRTSIKHAAFVTVFVVQSLVVDFAWSGQVNIAPVVAAPPGSPFLSDLLDACATIPLGSYGITYNFISVTVRTRCAADDPAIASLEADGWNVINHCVPYYSPCNQWYPSALAKGAFCPSNYSLWAGTGCIPYDSSSGSPTIAKNIGTPDRSACTGNPINIAVKSKFALEMEYASPALGGASLYRSYNSQAPLATGSFGSRWRHSYDRTVRLMATSVISSAYADRPDGKTYFFTLSDGAWMADSDVNDRVVRLTDSAGNLTGWRYTVAADDSVEEYDAAGRLLKITHRGGMTHKLSHSDGAGGILFGTTPNANGYLAPACAGVPGAAAPVVPGKLLCVTDPFGRQLNFAYDASSRIVKMTDPAGGLYQYEYDGPSGPAGANNLTSVTYPDGTVRTYHYNEPEHTGGANLPNALTGITDENGVRFATYQYDAQGRAIVSEHAGGAQRVALTYNADGSTTVTDALGSARTYGFQTILGVVKNTSLSQPAGAGCGPASAATTYDANGNVASRTDFNGVTTTYSYDLARNLETRRVEASGSAQARTVSTEWHASYRLPLRIAEPNRLTTFTYDAAGNLLTRSERATTDATGALGFGATQSGTTRKWTYTYNSLGQVLSLDGPRTDVTDRTSFAYDAATGNLLSVTNALGQVTSLSDHDPHGRPRTITDANGVVTTLSYDARGRLTSRTVGSETTTYSYDGVGQLTQASLPDGSFLAYTYDAAQRLTAITDARGNRLVFTLDALGNRVKEEAFDPQGALAQTRAHAYDALSRLQTDLGATGQASGYGYDATGNLTTATDPLAHTRTQGFDALNRLVRLTDPAGGVTQLAYNGQDRVTQVTDPRGLVTTYTVSGLGTVTKVVSPDAGTTNNTYDAAGNLKTSKDARAVTATYSYDALNRVTAVSYTGTGFSAQSLSFQYDQGQNGVGRLTGFTDPSGSTTLSYSAQGRVLTKSQTTSAPSGVTPSSVTLTLSHGYSPAGQLTSLTYPSGKTLMLTYAGGRVASLVWDGAVVLDSLAYHPFGAPNAWRWGNATAHTRSFDADGRLTPATTLTTPHTSQTWRTAPKCARPAPTNAPFR